MKGSLKSIFIISLGLFCVIGGAHALSAFSQVAPQTVKAMVDVRLNNGPDIVSPANNSSVCITAEGDVTASPAIRPLTCRGTDNQLWEIDADGKWHVSSDPNYCLAKIDGGTWTWTLTTKLCSSAYALKLYVSPTYTRTYVVSDSTGVALDNYGSEIGLYYIHGGSNQQFRWLQEDLAVVEALASTVVTYPLAATEIDKYNLEVMRDRVARLQPPYVVPASAYRDPAVFPGLVPVTATTAAKTFQFDLRFKDHAYLRMSVPPRNWMATGLYAPPSQILTVTVGNASATELKEVWLRIGSQTDQLSPTSGNVAGGSFLRYPSVSVAVNLVPGQNLIRSPYGGAIIFQSNVSVSKSIDITVANAIQAPYFNAGQTSEAEWLAYRSSPAPWGVFESESAVVHVPSSEINTLSYSDIYSTAVYYTQITRLHNELSGLSDNATLPHTSPQGKQWHSEDIHISAGWGHSGFPIMYYNAWHVGVPSESVYKSAGWGMWHEVGHNYQMGAWSYVYGTETTVNLFSLHAQEKMFGNSRLVDSNSYASAIAILNNASITDKYGNAGAFGQLAMLDQLRLAFPSLNWDLWTQVMRRYRNMTQSEIDALNTDLKKRSKLMELVCDITATDVSPHFVAWTISVTQTSIDYCKSKSPMLVQSWLIDGALPTRAGSGNGQMVREVWNNIAGSSLLSLTTQMAYPANPNTTAIVTSALESPTNVGSNFGERLRGYLHPPVTGDYYFWIANNETGSFSLSSDANPLNLRPIITLPYATDLRDFDKYAVWEQKSISLTLEVGKKYYFEVLHKESSGSDHVSIAWQIPAGNGAAAETRKVIDGRYLSPYVADVSLQNQVAAGRVNRVAAGGDITFTLTVSNPSSSTLSQVLLANYIPAGFIVSPLNTTSAYSLYRYVRFQALSEAGNRGGWASMAEFSVFDQNNQAISKNGWSIMYYDSQQDSGGNAAVNAIDGNPNTIWHTAWSPAVIPYPHEIQINLGKAYTITGFSYLPRSDSSNGTVGQYKIYVSVDGKTWLDAASGTFANNNALKMVSATVASPSVFITSLGPIAPNAQASTNVALRAMTTTLGTYNNIAEIVQVNGLGDELLIDPDATHDMTINNDAVNEDDRSQVAFNLQSRFQVFIPNTRRGAMSGW